MMKEDLIDRIRSKGHWRVNIRSIRPLVKKMTLLQCKEIVEKASVSLRGWRYPHVSRRNDEYGGSNNYGEYVENWCAWDYFFEFWRMYKSSQFIHYFMLREDSRSRNGDEPSGPFLSVGGTIYSITEMIEFSSRLSQFGLYSDGFRFEVRLGNTQGRKLWISDNNRMPFSDEKITQSNSINIIRDLIFHEHNNRPVDAALEILLELFDHFGWNPDPQMIYVDQERFYRKEW